MHAEWEIDTQLGSFESAAAAALAANGFGDDGIEELRLEDEHLVLIDVAGRRRAPAGEITVWKLGLNGLPMPRDMLFERVAYSLAELSALGLDGGFEPRQYRIIDDGSGDDVPIRVVVGRSRVLLLVDSSREGRGDVGVTSA
jgi:hypothetical protein